MTEIPSDAEKIHAERHDQILFRHVLTIALLFVIAAACVTIAAVEVSNRQDSKKAAKVLSDAADEVDAVASEYADYDACMDASETTSDECEAAFPTE